VANRFCRHERVSFVANPWWARWGSNPRPRDYESPALTAELRALWQVLPAVLHLRTCSVPGLGAALSHAALGRAVKWRLIAANPADLATPPSLTRPTVTAPTVDEVKLLIAEAQATNPVLATAVAQAAVTGARRGELCALRWSDVDWDRGVLRIARSLSVIRQQVSERPTKSHPVRQITIDTDMEAFLLARRAQQKSYAAAVGTSLVDDPYILSRKSDGSAPCLPDSLSQAYERLAKRLAIRTHFHELRHFAATMAIANGADVRRVAGRLGHAGPSVTLRVYAHALAQGDRDLAGMLGRAVLGTKPRQPSRYKGGVFADAPDVAKSIRQFSFA
jgi:integrase